MKFSSIFNKDLPEKTLDYAEAFLSTPATWATTMGIGATALISNGQHTGGALIAAIGALMLAEAVHTRQTEIKEDREESIALATKEANERNARIAARVQQNPETFHPDI